MSHNLAHYYDRYWSAEGWPTHEELRFSDRLRQIIASAITPDMRVLDAGCGDGRRYGPWLQARARAYCGVDIAESAVVSATALGLNARRIDDLTHLPFADGSFDACVCIEVLEHLVFPLDCARELCRVLRPGGVLVATVPNTTYLRRRLEFALIGRWHPGGNPNGAQRPWEDAHLRFFTRKTLRRMLAEAGFQTEVYGVNGALCGSLPYVRQWPGAAALDKRLSFLEVLAPSLFGANLAAVARKR